MFCRPFCSSTSASRSQRQKRLKETDRQCHALYNSPRLLSQLAMSTHLSEKNNDFLFSTTAEFSLYISRKLLFVICFQLNILPVNIIFSHRLIHSLLPQKPNGLQGTCTSFIVLIQKNKSKQHNYFLISRSTCCIKQREFSQSSPTENRRRNGVTEKLVCDRDSKSKELSNVAMLTSQGT